MGLTLLGAPAAWAQDGKAAAVQAYDEAEALMKQGKTSDACPRYAESQKLDPQLGTLLHLADCLEQSGQTASAWAAFREATDLAEQRGDARRELAQQRVAALTPKLSRLQINVSPVEGLRVARDNVPVGQTFWGSALPSDPGKHTITATAPGRTAWSTSVVVSADASTVTVNVPELEPAAGDATTSPATSVSADSAAGAPATATGPRWPAYVAGGVGVVGVAVGSIFGLKSMSKKDDADQHCSGSVCRDPSGPGLRQDAISAGNISTVGFVVGGVGLAAGAILWLALPTSADHAGTQPRLALGLGRNVMLEGRW